jgi:hypothetical protein
MPPSYRRCSQLRKSYQNLARCGQAICDRSAPQAVFLRLSAILRARTPHLVALLIALELGLLSPLSCVIHCFVQQLLAERPAIGFFLCGEHGQAPLATPADYRADPFTRSAPDPSPTPASTITPCALYELVALASPLLTVVSLLVAMLKFLPAPRLVPQILPPPTPPPRLSPA